MKKNSPQSYKVQCRTKTELKTTNQIPKSPLRMSSLVVALFSYKLLWFFLDLPRQQLIMISQKKHTVSAS